MAVTTFDLDELKRRMQGAVNAFKHELGGLRTGRASGNLLDPIQVDAYGSHMPINQVATISVPEPRLITVQVWDRCMVQRSRRRSATPISASTRMTEGQTIRLRIPELNEQRRKEMVKVAHKYAEEARIAVRHVRRDGMDLLKKLEKDGAISEDDEKRQAEQVQKVTDQAIGEIDQVARSQGNGDHAGLAWPHEPHARHARMTGDNRRPQADSAGPATRRGARRHVAIIMDGNGRWAAQRGLPRLEAIGAASRRCAGACVRAGELGIRYLTLYGFSSENWRGPPQEVTDLMGLLKRFIRSDLAELHSQQRAGAGHRRARRARRRYRARCSTRPRT